MNSKDGPSDSLLLIDMSKFLFIYFINDAKTTMVQVIYLASMEVH